MTENDAITGRDRLLRIDTRIYNLSFSLLLLLFVSWITLTSFAYSPAARLFPLTVSIVTLVLLILVVLTNVDDLREKSLVPDRLQFGTSSSDDTQTAALIHERRTSVKIIGWILGVILLIYVLGMDFALFVFLLAYYRYQMALGWVRSVAIAVGLWLFLIGIFAFVLGVPFPEGVFFEWVLG